MRLRSFPCSQHTEEHPLIELYGSRLFVNSQLWKTLTEDSIRPLIRHFPILEVLRKKAVAARKVCRAISSQRLEKALGELERLNAGNVSDEDEEYNIDDDDDDYDEYDIIPEEMGLLISAAEQLGPKKINAQKSLQIALKKLERSINEKARWPNVFKENLQMIANYFGLSDAELEILSFISYVKINSRLQEVINRVDFSRNTMGLIYEAISIATNLDEQFVRDALSEEGRLMSSGLLEFSEIDNYSYKGLDFEQCLQLQFEDKLFMFMTIQADKSYFLDSILKLSKEGSLKLDDFDHIPEVKTQLLPTLKNAVRTKKVGSNFLLYGASGTGKTELTRLMAEVLKMKLYTVTNGRGGLLGSLNQADNILAKTDDSLLVVDECDDIFNSELTRYHEPARRNKGKIVATLENNNRPTFWTCNSIDMMDDALLRRFDLIIKMPELNAEQRENIIRKKLGKGFTESFITTIAKYDCVSLAVLDRALSVARGLGHKRQDRFEHDMVDILNQTLNAQGFGKIELGDNNERPYDLSCVNTNGDLGVLVDGLKHCRRANICLFGAPGTGKSAYARWLAKQLNKPIMVRSAGQLFDKYVGETEKNIAEAFRDAEEQEAILVIDEADSFFRDRKLSQQSWEVTQVNEILTQMESFNGIFIATSNLMEDFDEASLRRFDMKVQFLWLKDEQKERLLRIYGQKMGIEGEASEEDLRKLRGLDHLSPGDFGNLMRRSKLSPIKSYSEFVMLLGNEQKMKHTDSHDPIGFN